MKTVFCVCFSSQECTSRSETLSSAVQNVRVSAAESQRWEMILEVEGHWGSFISTVASFFCILHVFNSHVFCFFCSFSLVFLLTLPVRQVRLHTHAAVCNAAIFICLWLLGIRREKTRHKDGGVARHRCAEQAEESEGGRSFLWHHPANYRAVVLGPQSCSGGRQRSLSGTLHWNGLEQENRRGSDW